MIFNTYWFVVFSAVVFPIYWLARLPELRRAWLLGACVVFHTHFAGPAGVLPIVALGLVTYFAALSRRRVLCLAAMVICVLALLFYKYSLFLSTSLLGLISPTLATAATTHVSALLPALPPLAISFFVFEFVHYLVDVSRGSEPLRSPADFALFSLHFPSLVAGPIKRYRDYVASLHAGSAQVSIDDVAAGAQRLALGFVKKILLADNLTLVIDSYAAPGAGLSTGESWLLLAAISARILLDFSGYTDIAIGLSRMLGVRLPENFNYPYLATSLQDFWQRWHISLTSWIRDYIYIPLGGSRHGLARKLLNGLIVFALCGLWHGAAWHFVLWGLWHGIGLAINHAYATLLGAPGRWLAQQFARFPALGWALTVLYVSLGWLLFFYEPARAWALALQLVGLGAS